LENEGALHWMRGKLIVGNPRRVDFQKDRDKGSVWVE
jgi:hypothetical protein